MEYNLYDAFECKLIEYKLSELILEYVFDYDFNVWLSKIRGCYRLTEVVNVKHQFCSINWDRYRC